MEINTTPLAKSRLRSDRNSGIFIQACIFFLPVAVTLLFISVYYEPNNEASYSAFADGAFSDGPFMDWYFLCHIFINKLYYIFYAVFPSVSWYKWFLFAYSMLGMALMFLVISKLVPERRFIAMIWTLLFFSALINPFYILSNVRPPVMICGGSLMLLLLNRFNYHSLKFWGLIFAFMLGSLIRLEPAGVALIIAFLFIFTCADNLGKALKILIMPGLFIAGMVIYISLDIRFSDSYYKKTEPDLLYQITEKGNVVPLSQMSTRADSVKYKAALWWMVTEPDIMTVDFLNSLVVRDKIFSTSYLRNRHMKTREILLPRIKKYYPILLLNFLLTGVAFFCLFQAGLKTGFIRLLAFNISAWTVVYLIAFFIKMEDRLFIALASLIIMFNCFYLLRNRVLDALRQKRKMGMTVLAGVFAIAVMSVSRVLAEKREFEETIAGNNAMINQLHDAAAGKTLVFSSTGLDMVETEVFSRVAFPEAKQVMCYDFGSYSLVERYKKFLDNACQCNSSSMPEFFGYLLENKHNVIYVSQMNRMELIREYMKVIHGMDISFMPVEASYPEGQMVRFYTIENL